MAVAGWFPDPSGRHEFRYWDGSAWTSVVSDHGVASQEVGAGATMLDPAHPAPAHSDRVDGHPAAPAYLPTGQPSLGGPGQWVPGTQQPPLGGPQPWGGSAPAGAAQTAPKKPGKKRWLIPVAAVACVLALVAALVGFRVWSNRAPSKPASITAAAASGDTIQLTWAAPNGGPDVEEYVISRNGTEVATVSGATLTFSDSENLNPADSYEYTVAARAHGKLSPTVGVDKVRTQAPKPSAVETSRTTDSITLSWEAPKSVAKPDSYVIYRDGEKVKTVAGGTTSYEDAGLNPATGYAYTVVSQWGERESDPTKIIKVKTAKPPVSTGRLAGDWAVTVKMVSNSGGDWPKPGKSWDEQWSINPKCDAGACSVVVKADVVPDGYTPKPFRITLKRSGGTYAGSTVTNITACDSTKVANTVVMTLKVAKSGVSSGAWSAQAFEGSVVIKSPYTDASGNYYCPAQSVRTAVAGRSAGF